MTTNKAARKKKWIRIGALAVAIVMTVTVVLTILIR